MTQGPPSPQAKLGIERHGIEFVPLAERYGTPWRLFAFWFSGSMTILGLSVGAVGTVAGLPLSWTVLALIAGNGVGTLIMAAHSAQGPRLGIPQMIQSRAQFGVIGAGVPVLAVVAATTLYLAAGNILMRGVLQVVLPLGDELSILLSGVLTLIVAFIGYELIHRLAAGLSALSALLYLSVAVLLFRTPAGAAAAPVVAAHFSAKAFMLIMTQAAAWSLSAGPYVADYSRYLPATVSAWRTFWFTGAGNFLGSTSIQALGAYMAFRRPDIIDNPGVGIADLFGSGRGVVATLIVLNLLQVNVTNLYSAYMSATTAISGLRGMRQVSLGFKFGLMALLSTIASMVAILTRDQFATYFSDFLALLLYGLVPWSAINLADYYLLRKGHYEIGDMFRTTGIYGRFRWGALGVYAFSILVQVPFMSLSFYSGPIAGYLGADIAWIPGLLCPAFLYYRVEVRRERRTVGQNL